MNLPLIRVVLLAWPLLVAILFGLIGPRRAALVGSLGGLLFLPKVDGPVFDLPFPVDKWSMTGLGLLLGVVFFDFRTLARFRPNWLDLAMLADYLAPLMGLMTGVPGSGHDVLDVMINRGLGWVMLYLMGRLYFGDGDGPRRVGVALMFSGLAYIPLCLFEEFAGPDRFLAGLIYGIPNSLEVVNRLGGYRPEVFLGHGVTLASWMASTTVVAAWLWVGGSWRPRKWPAWLPALALLATTISCRGVYGYLILAAGLSALGLTRLTRSRSILVTLGAIPFGYMIARASGLWDGRVLARLAGLTGRAGTVDFRLTAEDEIIRKVLEHNPIFGFGNYVWHGQFVHWPDGIWLHALWMGGLVGLGLHLLALHVLPAGLALSIPRSRPDGRQAASPAWGLAAWSLLQMIDGMHNTAYLPPIALVGGTLIGAFLSRKSAGTWPVGPGPREELRAGARGERVASSAPRSPVILAIAVACWLGIEALGQLSNRASVVPPTPPTPPVVPAPASR